MDDSMRQKVYLQYIDDTIDRFRNLSLLIAIGELCLMILDFQSDFFNENPLNHLNLLAEVLLIGSSFLVFWYCRSLIRKPDVKTANKVRMIVVYRIVIMFSVLLFIFTDIYVRHKAIGAYIVFLFVLQITPAFMARTNWLQFLIIGVLTVVEYIFFVSKTLNTLFATLIIFVCFAITTDYLRKYFIKQLENRYLAEDSNRQYRNLSRHTILALAEAVEAKDTYTKGHSQRVAEYSKAIAQKMGYTENQLQEVYFIALMHDIGKIGVPDAVINKTDRLTDEEFAEIKKHPVKGYDILKQINELPGISEGARWHHERWDGRGYPDGLKETNIPEIARIIAVADAYDAMTSNRSYRKALPQDVVRRQIEENAGTQFDPDMAKIMLGLIDNDTEYVMHEM